MVSSKETTPAKYLASLPAERRSVIATVRDVILAHLPEGYAEAMNWGMLSYEIPLSRHADTYNKQPLMYAALAAQKNNYAVYLMNVGDDSPWRPRLEAVYKAAGRRLDMGKCCLRFKSLAELPLDLIGEIVASNTVEQTIARYESAPRKARSGSGTTTTARGATSTATAKRARTKATSSAPKSAPKSAAKSAAKKSGAKTPSATRSRRASR